MKETGSSLDSSSLQCLTPESHGVCFSVPSYSCFIPMAAAYSMRRELHYEVLEFYDYYQPDIKQWWEFIPPVYICEAEVEQVFQIPGNLHHRGHMDIIEISQPGIGCDREAQLQFIKNSSIGDVGEVRWSVWQVIREYLLSYYQTTGELLTSGCETYKSNNANSFLGFKARSWSTPLDLSCLLNPYLFQIPRALFVIQAFC